MGRSAFMDAVFELADLWTETTDPEEYAGFLWSLLGRVAYWVEDGTALDVGASPHERCCGHYVWRDLRNIHFCEAAIRAEARASSHGQAAQGRSTSKTLHPWRPWSSGQPFPASKLRCQSESLVKSTRPPHFKGPPWRPAGAVGFLSRKTSPCASLASSLSGREGHPILRPTTAPAAPTCPRPLSRSMPERSTHTVISLLSAQKTALRPSRPRATTSTPAAARLSRAPLSGGTCSQPSHGPGFRSPSLGSPSGSRGRAKPGMGSVARLPNASSLCLTAQGRNGIARQSHTRFGVDAMSKNRDAAHWQVI